jgi:hypothetical protein
MVFWQVRAGREGEQEKGANKHIKMVIKVTTVVIQ